LGRFGRWLLSFAGELNRRHNTRDTTSGQEGLGLLSDIVAIDNTLPVIVMTAWGNLELAVEAMRRGARDFIQKPWENERLLSILRTQVELHRALQRAERGYGRFCP
jgi:FixJ family two-component response regulator